MNRTILFDGTDLVVISREAGRGRGVITFGPWSVNPLRASPVTGARGFGERSFGKFGLDELHVIPRRNHWYNCAERNEALRHAARFAGTRDVVTYGSSMGGYGAALFSALLGVPGIIIAPQFSLSPDVAPFEVRWREDYARIAQFDSAAICRDAPATGFLFYDPFTKLDALQAGLFRGRANCAFVPCPFSGHATAAMINRVYGLGRLASEIVDRQFSVAAFIEGRRAGRRDDHLYLSLLYIRARSRGRDALADQLHARLSAGRDQMGLKAISALFAFAMQRKDRGGAAAWANLAAGRVHRKPGDWLVVSRMLQRVGETAQARETLRRGIASAPQNAVLLTELQKL